MKRRPFLGTALFAAALLLISPFEIRSAQEGNPQPDPKRARVAQKSRLSVAPGYRVLEIPYAAHQMQWMDNENVIFAGARIDGGSPSSHRSTRGVYRWAVTTGEVVELMQGGDGVAVLCYDRGYVHIAFFRGDERVIREGPLGQESEIVRKRRGSAPPAGSFNPYNCRYREAPPATQADHKVITVLRDDHGFIEAEPWSERFPRPKYFLVRPSGQRTLLKNFHGGPGRPPFSEFQEAYVFQNGGSDLSSNADKRIRAIGVDGTVVEYRLPKGPWLGGGTKAMPVRDGILLISPALPKAQGAYLVKGQQVELLMRGYVGSFAVSPDGCKLAASIRSGSFDDNTDVRNVVMNICGREK